jgi:uncharacterized protein (TIGR02145 family)
VTGWEYYTGTDDYGFSALPGGIVYGNSFYSAGNHGGWWGATENDVSNAWGRYMDYNFSSYVGMYHGDKTDLLSLRCVSDERP